jgi:hypothetical protein
MMLLRSLLIYQTGQLAGHWHYSSGTAGREVK